MLMILLTASVMAAAQNKSEQTEKAAGSTIRDVTIIRLQSSPPGWTISRESLQSGSLTEGESGDRASISGSRFAVINGAVYLGMPASNVFVPMVGGGASGCFSLDLTQRIERLRNFIETDSFKTGSAPAIRQLEAYAM
jgi:hypothetical protein